VAPQAAPPTAPQLDADAPADPVDARRDPEILEPAGGPTRGAAPKPESQQPEAATEPASLASPAAPPATD
jgi:hypothetical protein